MREMKFGGEDGQCLIEMVPHAFAVLQKGADPLTRQRAVSPIPDEGGKCAGMAAPPNNRTACWSQPKASSPRFSGVRRDRDSSERLQILDGHIRQRERRASYGFEGERRG